MAKGFTYADFLPKGYQKTTGRFGESRPGHQHSGYDYAAPMDTPVFLPYGGEIINAGPMGSYGNLIGVKTPQGYTFRVGHLNRFADGVKVGGQYTPGQPIAYVGSTGRSTGPHAHTELMNPKGGFEDLEAFDRSIFNAMAQNAAPTIQGSNMSAPVYNQLTQVAPPEVEMPMLPRNNAPLAVDPGYANAALQQFDAYTRQPIQADQARAQAQYSPMLQQLQAAAAASQQPHHLGAGRAILAALLGAGVGGALGSVSGNAAQGALLGAAGGGLGAYTANNRANAARQGQLGDISKAYGDLLTSQNTAMNDAVTREKGVTEVQGKRSPVAVINRIAELSNKPDMALPPGMVLSDEMTKMYLDIMMLPEQERQVAKSQIMAQAAGLNSGLNPGQQQTVSLPVINGPYAPSLGGTLTGNEGLAAQYLKGQEYSLKQAKQPYDLAKLDADTRKANADTAKVNAELPYVNETAEEKRARGLRSVYGNSKETDKLIQDDTASGIYGKEPVTPEIIRLIEAAHPNDPAAQEKALQEYVKKQTTPTSSANPQKEAMNSVESIAMAMEQYGFLDPETGKFKPPLREDTQAYQLFTQLRDAYNRAQEGVTPGVKLSVPKAPTPGKLQSKYAP